MISFTFTIANDDINMTACSECNKYLDVIFVFYIELSGGQLVLTILLHKGEQIIQNCAYWLSSTRLTNIMAIQLTLVTVSLSPTQI